MELTQLLVVFARVGDDYGFSSEGTLQLVGHLLTDQEIATIVDPASKEHITRVAVESLLRKYTCVTL